MLARHLVVVVLWLVLASFVCLRTAGSGGRRSDIVRTPWIFTYEHLPVQHPQLPGHLPVVLVVRRRLQGAALSISLAQFLRFF